MEPEITLAGSSSDKTDSNNNAKGQKDERNANTHRRSSLHYSPITVDDLMSGNFNVYVQKNIGSGYGGSVYKCLVYHDSSCDEENNATTTESSVMAIKVLSKERTKARVAVNEVELLRIAKSPNVLSYVSAAETIDSYLILTEFCAKGDLHGMLRHLDERDILTRDYMRDVISGLECLHNKLIAHADIKMKNILITDKNVAKIADKDKKALFQGLLANKTERWSLQMAKNNTWLNEYASPPSSPV
ncbi:protein kinase-like domain [Elysia marginata]|uniref:Protein kinase-like domain n=1 Tax=Elysia marginata TaxID=1093978 RepID=A0AAV4EDQ4_9GAST|nr:protein kinase-like domain [Elysia marginata]